MLVCGTRDNPCSVTHSTRIVTHCTRIVTHCTRIVTHCTRIVTHCTASIFPSVLLCICTATGLLTITVMRRVITAITVMRRVITVMRRVITVMRRVITAITVMRRVIVAVCVRYFHRRYRSRDCCSWHLRRRRAPNNGEWWRDVTYLGSGGKCVGEQTPHHGQDDHNQDDADDYNHSVSRVTWRRCNILRRCRNILRRCLYPVGLLGHGIAGVSVTNKCCRRLSCSA